MAVPGAALAEDRRIWVPGERAWIGRDPPPPESLEFSYEHLPTLRRFAESDALVRGVMGPVGGAKTSACCWEVFRRAMKQEPGSDGVRRSRCVVIRNTDKELRDTTLKTWFEWFPNGRAGTWHDTRRIFALRARDRRGRLVMHCEVIFRALDIPKQVRDVLGLELTFAYINEARETDEAILRGILNKGRLGRYPSRRNQGVGATWYGVWMDTNPPDDLSWWYRVFEEDELDNEAYQLFRQPSARGPNAENLPNLDPDYYPNLMQGADDNYVKVYVDAQYGTVLEGKPVYKGQWNDALHVSDVELWPMKRQPISLGWDFGLTPAVVICQRTPRGQFRVLDEVCGEGMGVRQLIRGGLMPLLQSKYRGFEIEESRGDPSGWTDDDSDSDHSPAGIVGEEGLPIEPAITQDPRARWEAVRWWLIQLLDARPAFLLNPTCRMLRRGFNGAYRFRKLQISGPIARYHDKADKGDPTSHPHDALQYIALQYLPEDRKPKPDHQPRLITADQLTGF